MVVWNRLHLGKDQIPQIAAKNLLIDFVLQQIILLKASHTCFSKPMSAVILDEHQRNRLHSIVVSISSVHLFAVFV